MGCQPSSNDESSKYSRSIMRIDKLIKLLAKVKNKHKKYDKKIDQTEYHHGVLRLDFRHEWVTKFIDQILEGHRLDHLPTLALRYLPEPNETINELFQTSISEVDNLFVNNYVTKEYRVNKMEIGSYLGAIVGVVPKVKDTLWVEHFKISARDAAKVIRKSAHLKSVRFEW